MRYSLLPERNKALAKPNTSMLGSIEYAESIDVGGYFDGNVRVIHEGPIGTLIDLPYVSFSIIKKTVATQSGDYAMILRVKSSVDGDRITIVERTSGKINCRVRKGNGTVAREIESDFIPALGDTYRVFIIWDGSTTLTQLIYCDGVAYVKTSTTHVSIPADSDPNGFISMAQTYEGLYPLKARSILGGFSYGVYTVASITSLCEAGRVPVGSFLYNPGVMGNYNTNVIREPNGRNMTVIPTESVEAFWNNTI